MYIYKWYSYVIATYHRNHLHELFKIPLQDFDEIFNFALR
jgi:hypothetical protein